MLAWHAPSGPICLRSTTWRHHATRDWTSWRMQWTTWTPAVTSTRSWICITRCSVLQCALNTCHTWEMRWDARKYCSLIIIFLFLSNLFFLHPQVCQVSAQQPVQTELLMRYHQLQSRLATLKIENEEVRAYELCLSSTSSPLLPLLNKKPSLIFPKAIIPSEQDGHITIYSHCNYSPMTPLSAGAGNIFRLSHCQCCVFYEVIYDEKMKRDLSH